MSTAAPPPHPDPLPVVKRTISSLPCNVNRDVKAASAIVEGPPPHPNLLPVVERAIGDLQCTAQRDGEASSQNATAELYLPDEDRDRGGFENSASGSIGIRFSAISVSVNRDDKIERQSTVQALSRLASKRNCFGRPMGGFAHRFRWVIGSRSLGSGRRRFATG